MEIKKISKGSISAYEKKVDRDSKESQKQIALAVKKDMTKLLFFFLILLGLLPGWESIAFGGGGWVNATDAPFLFTAFDAEFSTTTNKVYFLGGRLSDCNTDGSVWQYDPVTGVYADTGTDMPVPISEYTIARVIDSVGDEVFMLFGGRPQAGGVVNTVQGYKPGTNTTINLTATDPYPVSTSVGGVAVVNNIVYCFGGFNGGTVIPDTYFFDITADDGSRWTTGPTLTVGGGYMAVAVVDNVIYRLGGDTFTGVLFPMFFAEKLDGCNPTIWNEPSVADLPVMCGDFQGFGFDTTSPYNFAGKLVTAGCGQWPNEIAESMSYDVATNTWDQTFPDLNNARRNHAAAFIPLTSGFEGVPGMWVWGGRQGSDSNILATPEYHLVTNACLNPPTITSTSLPNGTEGVPYNQQLIATGGTPPYTWSIISCGALPPGLNLDPATGVISGTPDAGSAGTYNFKVSVGDSVAGCFDTQDLSITIDVTGACTYSNDFNNGVLEWTEEKPTVTEPGDGFLHLTPLKKKAIAVADSAFPGATTGTFTFDIQFTGGVDAKNWIYTHRIDKKNAMEVLFKVEQGKVVVKDRGPNGIEDKAKAIFPLAANTPYNVVIAYNGTSYAVVINGTAVITGFSPVGALPNANIGGAAKNNTLMIDNVCVN